MFETLERGLYWLSSFGVSADSDALCQLRAPINDDTFVTQANSLLTMFRVVGSRRYIGVDEFDAQSAALTRALEGVFKSGQGGAQHSLLFGFRSDPGAGERVLRDVLGPSLATAKRLGADVRFLFDDRLRAMGRGAIDEIAVFGLLTHTAGLTPSEQKRWELTRREQFGALGKAQVVIDDMMTQSPMGPPAVMMSRHQAALATLEGKISASGAAVQVMMDRMSCSEVAGMMRRFLDAGFYDPRWRPRLLGDHPAATNARRSAMTVDHGLPLRLGRQLVTDKLIESFADAEIVKRGAFWYASVTLDQCPSETPTPTFAALAESIGTQIPWQVHFDVSPNGLDQNKMERMFASFVGSAGEHNRAIKRGFDELVKMREEGTTITALRAIFTTWAKSENGCIDQMSFLKSKVEGWGQSVASNESGAPAHLLLAGTPGFARQLPAPFLPGPLDAFCRMAPMFRPSSIWASGQLVLFTSEGRPYPINLGTTDQNFWGTLCFAPTGSGKSFLMNMFNTGVLFRPGASDLPLCTIIDKGPSAKGVVMLAHAVLPEHLAKQVVYWRPTPSDTSYCVNPFDTQLGCDRPLDSDRDFLSALLGGIAPNLGHEGGKFIGLVIDVVYECFCRTAVTAKRWQWNTNADLSAKLASIGIQFTEEKPPRVWDVVDAFFAAGMIGEAGDAQFYAMPLLTDVSQVLQHKRIQDVYGGAKSPSGELIVEVFTRNVIAAAGEYQLFSGVTRHKSAARFVVVDIEGLASASTSEEGQRRFGLMMLFARRLGARNFFLHPQDIAAICPKMYLPYQLDRVQRNQEQLKFLEYDEIHNAKGIGAVQNLLQKDAREGRKYNVVSILSSQDLADFPEDLVKNCYNFFILGAGNADSGRELKRTFDLTDSELEVILSECTSPGKMFGMFRTNRGMLSQLLHTRPGSLEIWAFNTSATDMALRDALYEEVGVRLTLGFLAEVFPGGSARKFIDEMRNAMSDRQVDQSSFTKSVIRELRPKLQAYVARIDATAKPTA